MRINKTEMGNIKFARLILLIAAIMSAGMAYDLTTQTIVDDILTDPENYARNNHTVSTGLHNSALGFCLISGLALIAFSITFIPKTNISGKNDTA